MKYTGVSQNDCNVYAYTGTMTEFMVLARASAHAGVDVWDYSNRSTGYGNLRNSLAWMAPYCAKVRKTPSWPRSWANFSLF